MFSPLHTNSAFSSSDPRKGRAKRVLAILVLAAAAGAARAQIQQTQQPIAQVGAGRLLSPLAERAVAPAANLLDVAFDEARLLPCTVADVAGEFARLAQTGVLQMEELPCEAWVKMTIADGFGDDEALAARAGAGAPTVAFALSPEEALALKQSGVVSGKAVSLNDLVSEVAVGPRTPGFGGALGRILRRTQDTVAGAVDEVASSWTGSAEQRARADKLKLASRKVDDGRPFPEEAAYAPLAFGGNAATMNKLVEDLDPKGAIVFLTAAQKPGITPNPPNNGQPVPTNPVSLDLRPDVADAVLSVSGAGKLSAAPDGERVLRAAGVGVGGIPTSPVAIVGSAEAVARLTADQALGR